jgi:hypothetical protein
MWKSVREATVFGLLGMLVAIIGTVVATESRAGCEARTYAATMVHGGPGYPYVRLALARPAQKGGITKLQPQEDGITKLRPIPGKQLVKVPVGGRDLWVWVCVESEKSRGVSTEMDEGLGDCRHIQNPVRTLDVLMPGLSAEDQTAIEKDYWGAYRQATRAILTDPKSWPPMIGLYGFLAGLGIWIFYRLARF